MPDPEQPKTQDEIIAIVKRLIDLDRERPDHITPNWVWFPGIGTIYKEEWEKSDG